MSYLLTKQFIAFIREREAIRVKKEMGCPRPWTSDPILDTYRFCNIHREDDRVTQELKAWAELWDVNKEENGWFWWVAARLFNKQQTMAVLDGKLIGFKPERAREALKKQRERGFTIFNAAYIVSTNGIAMDKVDYIIDRVLKPLWQDRKRLRPSKGDSLATYHALLMGYDGLGSFLAAQVIADLKYAEPLKRASDWWTFAASGPGSRRGLNRVMGQPPEQAWKRNAWEAALLPLLSSVNAAFPGEFHAQDVQNCLCEFDKYQRALEGGRPKQLYKEK